MKTIRILAALAALAGTLFAQSPFLPVNPVDLGRAEVFRVGMVGESPRFTRERLIQLFALFQAQHTVNASGKILSQIEHIFRVDGVRRDQLAADIYQVSLAGNGAGASDVFYLQTLRSIDQRDAKVRCYAVKLPSATITGLDKDLVVYREVDFSDPQSATGAPTREQFVSALQTGETFRVIVMQETSCQRCYGTGKHRGLASLNQQPDRQYPCVVCETKGHTSKPILVELVWR